MFVSEHCGEIGFGFEFVFNVLYETVQTLEAVEFFFVADSRGVETFAQHV